MGLVYADSVKEQMVPKVLVEETLCPMGTRLPGMAFKEKEVSDTLSATKGQWGKPVRDISRVWVQDLRS